jgi:outer membrane protein OmpA-like peptidoglycan-associated protein
MRCIPPVILCIGLFLSNASAQGDVEKIPSSVNTDLYDETTPVLNKKGDRLFFTRTADPDFEPTIISGDGLITSMIKDALYMDRLAVIYSQIAGRNIANPSASNFNQDIWLAPVIDDTIREAIHPGYPLNNALPNSLVSTGMSKNEFVILNQFFKDGSMYAGFSRIHIDENGEHTFPEPMHIYEFNVTGSDVNLTMTPDGHILVLSMTRSDSRGLNDFYVSFYVRPNVWSAPLHMGQILNSAFQETTPHISPDKRYLYFSSNRTGSLGGNDIYVSERLDYSWLKWSEPAPVNGEVNSIYDDSQPYFDPSGNYMYFTSKRDGTSDIFRQRLTPRPRLKKPLYVRGKIINSVTGQPVHSELFWGQHSSMDYLEYFNTYTGEFEVELTEYEPYKFKPRKANHNTQRIIIDPRGMEDQGIDTLDLVLYVQPKELRENSPAETKKNTRQTSFGENKDQLPPQRISFYNINFIKGKAIILTKSRGALKYLEELMVDNPSLEILIEGHTDNVGDETALIDLSLQRAEAIRNYLVNKGIEKGRMQVSGLGATRPLVQNTSESGRERNRRVEISIIKQ